MSFLERHASARVIFGVAALLSVNAALVAASLPVDPLWTGASMAPAAASAGPVEAVEALDGIAAVSTPGGSVATLLTPTRAPTPTSTSSPLPAPLPTRTSNREYRVPILMYHRVVPTAEAAGSEPGLVVSPELFSAQMQALYDAGWHAITLRDLAQAMRDARTLPPRTFVITFDDGWADGYDYAYPIMVRYGYVGVFFVITSRIDMPGFLSSSDLLELQANGNEIGNHTAHHVSLSTVSYQQAKQEIETASARIAQVVYRRPTSLAYPMGGVADYVERAVSETDGLQIAVTTQPGVTESWLDRLALPRVRVSPSTGAAALVSSLT